MKNKKIILLGFGLLLVVTTLVVSIAAWLTDVDETPNTTFTIGNVEYSIVGDFIADGIIVPGQQLITTTEVSQGVNEVVIKLTNKSTVNSKIRLRIEVKVDDEAITTLAGLSSIFTTGNPGGGFALPTDWKQNLVEELTWYYGAAVSGVDANDLGAIILPSTKVIPVLNSLKLDGSKVGNDYAKKGLTIKFIFEAKQADYVTWEQLATASINFSTGI